MTSLAKAALERIKKTPPSSEKKKGEDSALEEALEEALEAIKSDNKKGFTEAFRNAISIARSEDSE